MSEILWGKTAKPGLCVCGLWNICLLRILIVLSSGLKDYQASTQLEEGVILDILLDHVLS